MSRYARGGERVSSPDGRMSDAPQTRGTARRLPPPAVTPAPHGRQHGMSLRKILSIVGSVVVSSVLGWAGSKVGVMTGFMLGMVGTGVGMYAGYKLAERLES